MKSVHRLPVRGGVLAVVALAAGCGAAPTASPSVSPMAGAGSAKVAPVTGPRIEGTVVSSVDRTRALTAVVYLEDAPKQPGALTTAEVDVKNKDFTPPVAVVTAGGSVTFGNKDALTHHVFSPDVPNWDTGYLQKDGASPAHRFDTPGAFSLLCNIHPEMIGYVLVIPSTAFGRVGPDGKYVIGNVPPGSYRATAWSPHMKPMTQPVTIGPSGATKLSFELQPAGAGTSG